MPHIHEKIDFTVDVFIIHNNTVLLRKHDKYDKWLAVGGHIELDEDPIQAAIRECKEETGLDVTLLGTPAPTGTEKGFTELLAPRFLNIHNINETHEHVSLIYFATSDSDEINPTHDGDLSEECVWLTANEVKEHDELLDNVRYYALAALEAYTKET